MRNGMIIDDRTDEQLKTHQILIGGYDRVLSYWGEAKGMESYALWACKPEDTDYVLAWCHARTDLDSVKEYTTMPRRAHVHIYFVRDDHPAKRGNA